MRPPLGTPPEHQNDKVEPIVLLVCVLVIIGFILASSLPPIS